MTYLLICSIALLASGLTFFSGFGLGTLLLPAFALFFPLEHAIAMTAVVHLFNGLFKFALVFRHVDWSAMWRFTAPAIVAALIGALLLDQLGEMPTLHHYAIFDRALTITPIKLTVGMLLLVFALIELMPATRMLAFSPRWLPLGGVISGFFGGLAGMQGALRSAFLIRLGLSKQAFIATGVASAVAIDLARLGVYARSISGVASSLDYTLLASAVFAAFAGAYAGNRLLTKITLPTLQRGVAMALLLAALALIAGLI